MFKIETDKVKKTFTVKVKGFFKENEGIDFLDEYKKNTSAITPSEYSLIVDGTELSISKPEMLPILNGCFNLYKSTGFKKNYGLYPKSSRLAFQLKRFCEECHLDMEFGYTREDLFNRL